MERATHTPPLTSPSAPPTQGVVDYPQGKGHSNKRYDKRPTGNMTSSLIPPEQAQVVTLHGVDSFNLTEWSRGAERLYGCLNAQESAGTKREGSSKFSVIQPPTSSTVILGGTGMLQCTFSPGSSANGGVSWHKSPIGGSFSLSKPVNMKQRLSLAFPDSFLQQADASLIVANASLEDAGIYFCKVMLWDKGEAHGDGTPLLVYVPPTQPMISFLQATRSDEKNSLVCRTEGFYPSPVRLTWSIIGLPAADAPPAPLECQNKEGIGHMLSTLTLPDLPPSGGSATVLCSVIHPSLSHPLTTNYTYRSSEKRLSVSLIQCLNILKIGLVIALTLHCLFGKCREKRKQKTSKEDLEETNFGWSSRTRDQYPKHALEDAKFKQQSLEPPPKSVWM